MLPEWTTDFLAQLAEVPNVSAACRYAGISRQAAYVLRESSEDFARRWDDAIEESTDDLVGHAYQAAKAGDTTLTIFLLKCHRRKVYGDRIKHDLDDLDDEELVARATAALGGGRASGADDPPAA